MNHRLNYHRLEAPTTKHGSVEDIPIDRFEALPRSAPLCRHRRRQRAEHRLGYIECRAAQPRSKYGIDEKSCSWTYLEHGKGR